MIQKIEPFKVLQTLVLVLMISCSPVATDDPLEDKINKLLAQMSLEEKVAQLSGDGKSTPPNERLGIPGLHASDGPFGAHGRGPVTAFPSGVCLASAWNADLMQEVGRGIGNEANTKGINLLLGPCVNMARHPLGGRNFESYGEDPFLAGKLAAAYVNGVQSEKVAACIKHYAVNNQEWYRHFYSAEVDERTLREIYLPAFEMAVKEADVWSVMTSYNKINGTYAGEHKYLVNDILKNEWGFRGITIPDWTGAHNTVNSANAGLDVIVYDSDLYRQPLVEAVKNGSVGEQVLDELVRRTLRVKYLTGSFDPPGKASSFQVMPAHQELARQAAREGIVLLKNEEALLPLEREQVKKIAVIGPNAAELRYGGGGSSFCGEPTSLMSPLEAIRQWAAEEQIEVTYTEGVSMVTSCDPVRPVHLLPSNTTQGDQGLWGEYFNNRHLEGEPVFQRLDSMVDFKWGIGPPIFLNDTQKERNEEKDEDERLNQDNFSVRWTGFIQPPKTGPYSFVVATDDGIRVYLDDQLVIDNWWSHDVEYQYSIQNLVAGRKYKLKLEYYEEIGGARMSFGWQYHDPADLEQAVTLAKEADAVVACVGLSKLWEAEAYDRVSMDLPSIQNELVDRVQAVNGNTVVVLNTSGSITYTPWMGKVKGLLQAWYPGQGGSEALADILFGRYNPSAKLPVTMIKDKKDYPPAFDGYQDPSLKVNFSEGVFMGYRYHDQQGTDVLFPFGYGLSYTTFHYEGIEIEKTGPFNYQVRVTVENTGQRPGQEIIQLYVSDKVSSVKRPVKELKAFGKVDLQPGEKKEVALALDRRSFAYYDVPTKDWKVEPGEFEVLIGASSKDIRLTGSIKIP